MTNVVVYLDTNILSRVTDLNIPEETAIAYRRLADIPGLSLVTSAKTKQEMERTPNGVRASMLVFLFGLFAKVPWRAAEYGGAINGAPLNMCALNGSWMHPALSELRAIFDEDDATHIFQAFQAGCQYFLTLDEKTILSRARQHHAALSSICPQLQFRSPIELVEELLPLACDRTTSKN